MTELWPFSWWQGRRHCDLQEASSLEKHNRVLSEALPKGWADCPRSQGWQLQLGLSSWAFSPGYPGRFCLQINLVNEVCLLPLNSGGVERWRYDLWYPGHFHGVSLLLLVILWGSSCDWVPLEFLTLRVVHMEPPGVRYLQLRFSCPSTGWGSPLGGVCSKASAPVNHDSMFTRLSNPVRACSVAQSCLTLGDPTDCSQPGSSVHGIIQSRILE